MLPPNAQFIMGGITGKKLGYECVDGYELQDDGSCEDIDECDQNPKVSALYHVIYILHELS